MFLPLHTTLAAMKCNAQEVAIEKSDETDGEKKPKSAKTNADAMAELAQKGGQGFACTSMWWGCPEQRGVRVRQLEAVDFESIRTCEADATPTIINTTCKWYDKQLKKNRFRG